MPAASPSPRTRVRRVAKRARYDRASVESILDEALVCHVAFLHDGQPFCIPTLHARVGDDLLIHGAASSRMVRALEAGGEACVTATLLDGLVLARSAFHHSMNYRSAMVLARFRRVEGVEAKTAALEAFTEQLGPGLWPYVRPPSAKELKGTAVLALPLTEASAKVRTGPPVDDDADYELDAWAGVVPLASQRGTPEPDPLLRPGIEAPTYVVGSSGRGVSGPVA